MPQQRARGLRTRRLLSAACLPHSARLPSTRRLLPDGRQHHHHHHHHDHDHHHHHQHQYRQHRRYHQTVGYPSGLRTAFCTPSLSAAAAAAFRQTSPSTPTFCRDTAVVTTTAGRQYRQRPRCRHYRAVVPRAPSSRRLQAHYASAATATARIVVRPPPFSTAASCQSPSSHHGPPSSSPSSSSSSPIPAANDGAGKIPAASQQQRLQQQEPTHHERSRQPSGNGAPKPVLHSTIQTARKATQNVTQKVRSSLTGLTPRENIYNLPNFLTVSRLVAAPATGYLLYYDHHKWALALFAYAGSTDLVDGWLARRWKLQTVAGSVIDPMADKALMIILTVTLAAKGAIPLYLATLILGRDASLAIAAVYYRYASLPAPKTFMRYWDFSLPSAEVHPTTVSKYNTLLQLVLIGSTVALPVVVASPTATAAVHAAGLSKDLLYTGLTALQLLVAATTAWSGLSYAYLKDAVTILGTDESLKAKQGARGRAIIGLSFGGVVVVALWLGYTADSGRSDAGDGGGNGSVQVDDVQSSK